MILRCGEREFQFHFLGIGNTAGDAVLYLPKEKVLIPGDLVVHPSPYESGAYLNIPVWSDPPFRESCDPGIPEMV